MLGSQTLKCLIFSSLFLIVSCCASNSIVLAQSQNEPAAIDVDNFDPYDYWKRMTREIEERERSKTINYYLVGSEDIRLVIAAESDEEKVPPLAYDSITDMKGRPHFIAKTMLLDRDDIELIYIEKTTYRDVEQYIIGLLFKMASWDKVHDWTANLRGQRLALIKGEKLLSAPVVQEAIVEAAKISGEFNKADMDWFVQGFIDMEPPSTDRRESAFIEWLEGRVQKYPDDTNSIQQLTWRYYDKKEPNCKKITNIYEKAVRHDPSRSMHLIPPLNSCYKTFGTYDDAITFYSAMIGMKKLEPFEEASIRMALADVYASKGDTQRALNELETTLTSLKSISFSYPWLEQSAHKTEIEKQLSDSKVQLIKLVESEIDKIKAQERDRK